MEAGAHDGIFQSNTLLLEKQGWTGILIEPSMRSFTQLQKNRPKNVLINCALNSDPSMDTITGSFEDGLPTASALKDLQQRHPGQGRFRGENRIRRSLHLPPRVQVQRVQASTLAEVIGNAGFRLVFIV